MTDPIHLDAFIDAVVFATQKHQGQVRKDSQASPYVTHPLAVARMLYTLGKIYDTSILVAAVLHDTIEDTNTTEAEIREQFGEETLSIVLELTDDKSLAKNIRKQHQVMHASKLSSKAKTIKLGDKLTNCQDILQSPPKNWTISRRQEYIQWAADVVAQIRSTNPHLEAAFDEMLLEAEISLNFTIEPFETIKNRPWGFNTHSKHTTE